MFDLLPDLDVRLHSVGRLDYDAEGLLLLTNDGDLTYRLTHPRYGVPRTYHVLVAGQVDDRALARLRRGVLLEDGPARPDEARRLDRPKAGHTWLALTLREGRYREVKRLCRAGGPAGSSGSSGSPTGRSGSAGSCPAGGGTSRRSELAALRADTPGDAACHEAPAQVAPPGALHYTR